MIDIQRCNDKQQWDDFILEHDGHPLQLWGWGQVKAMHGWSVERICAYDGEKQIGAAQVLFRTLPFPFRSFAYIPRGPIAADRYQAEFLKRIAHLAKRDYKALALSIEPNSREITLSTPWIRSKNKILAEETILLDLDQSKDELLSTMAKKTRQYIRKSATDVQIKQVRSQEDLTACLEIYKETAARANFNLHAKQYYLDIQQQMDDHSPVFAAYVDGKPVAFLWLAVSAFSAYELYGGMNEEGQRVRANYALKWYVIQKMKEWGVQQYDFGGLVAGGVSIFKQGWAESTTLAGTYDFPLSPFYGLWTKALPKAKKVLHTIKRR